MKKLILLTGATRGLGLAVAQRLTEDPDYVIVGVGRSETKAFRSLREAYKSRVFYEEYDFADLGGIKEFVLRVTKNHGHLFGLINNAAIGADGVLATQHASDIAQAIRVNLEAPILLTKYACRSMLGKRAGRIINIGSIIGSTGFSGLSVYASTKAGIEGFTRSLSRELAKVRITVNCVAPGYMETDMTAGLEGEKLASIRRRAPLGLPAPADVANAVAFLLSDEASMMTGAILKVDGGSTA